MSGRDRYEREIDKLLGEQKEREYWFGIDLFPYDSQLSVGVGPRRRITMGPDDVFSGDVVGFFTLYVDKLKWKVEDIEISFGDMDPRDIGAFQREADRRGIGLIEGD